ncbi:MAG: hypothetical protein ACHQF3_09200 [Alphaproteobacteria bacterium]
MTIQSKPVPAKSSISASLGRPSWRCAGTEPALSDVLADPLVRLVMRRDGVSLPHLSAVIARAQAGLRADPCCRSAP